MITVPSKRIWGVECSECNKRMFSFHVHDYKVCECPNQTMVDGGTDYLRYGWKDKRPKKIYWSKKDGKYPAVKQRRDTFPY